MTEDERQIRDLVVTWMSATRSGDLDTVMALMTDDVVFLVAGRPPFGKQEFAQALTSPAGAVMPTIDGHSEIQEIQVSGNWAFMWTRLTVEVTFPGGNSTRRTGHTLTVLHKKDGKWLVARDANLLTPITEQT